jgi:hypothetical protein
MALDLATEWQRHWDASDLREPIVTDLNGSIF